MKKEIIVSAHRSKTKDGKVVMVPTYSYFREVGSQLKKGSGKEHESMQGSFVTFTNWDEYQDAMNEIGWENQTLFKSRKFKKDGTKKTLHITDPRNGEQTYHGLKVGGKLVGYTTIGVNDKSVWVGDFEIFQNQKRKGYGRLLFDKIKNAYPNKTIELTFGDSKARKFWESMGFKRYGNTKMMSYEP